MCWERGGEAMRRGGRALIVAKPAGQPRAGLLVLCLQIVSTIK